MIDDDLTKVSAVAKRASKTFKDGVCQVSLADLALLLRMARKGAEVRPFGEPWPKAKPVPVTRVQPVKAATK